MHKSMNGVVNNICVRDYKSSDLSWKKTVTDTGNALLSHYLEQTDQKDKMRRIAAKEANDRYCVNVTMEIDDYVTIDEIKHILRHAKK
jgi:hypothetical protein